VNRKAAPRLARGRQLFAVSDEQLPTTIRGEGLRKREGAVGGVGAVGCLHHFVEHRFASFTGRFLVKLGRWCLRAAEVRSSSR
jgi:hypothetical protein